MHKETQGRSRGKHLPQNGSVSRARQEQGKAAVHLLDELEKTAKHSGGSVRQPESGR